MDKGSGSLVVQVTSSPVSLGQEFSSQSPQVPQEAQGPRLQGVCELEWKVGNNPMQCLPMLVTLHLAQKRSVWGLPLVGNIRMDPAGPQKTWLGVLFFGKLCVKPVLFLSAFKLHFCVFFMHTCSRVCVYICPGAHACCVCACGSRMSSLSALFLVFFEAGSR